MSSVRVRLGTPKQRKQGKRALLPLLYEQEGGSGFLVTVDANGNADGGHFFTKIDESNFYIDDIKYTANQGDLSVTGYNKNFFKGAAKIINKLVYQGRQLMVKGIAKKAFKECTMLTSITIPNSLKSIGNDVFYKCYSLTSVTIPNSVTYIDVGAFSYCSSLTDVYCLAESVPWTNPGVGVFDN